ncbi:hypothetical protein M3I53_01290 [Paraburkholderia sp. CNPSo 3272]|uniref:hypothetical protein n=1 Tax=Paraburkholderia sp. CNPSo 3272 TaxID=2940931 RepID=UPI0020B8AF2A|nr:hypothetical protein [Paraburkholderia sp. CNPSo 3272]MCP3721771.1 hypothetical protein [Paraburkholderia sp. CNPSo 3272]
MDNQRINPEKVTKPIQLLAAWLVGLIVVNASFLLAAQQISHPTWAASLLVISSVVNVPIFIGALFLLQTKFRPQMQEDSYYSQYLKESFGFKSVSPASSAKAVEKEISEAADKIVKKLGVSGENQKQPIAEILRESQVELLVAKFGGSRSLSELYKSPKTWGQLISNWGRSDQFRMDVDLLISEGLVENKYSGYRRCKLTAQGHSVAKKAEEEGIMWYQKNSDYWEAEHAQMENSQT